MWVRQWAGLEVAKRRGAEAQEVRSAGGATKGGAEHKIETPPPAK